MTAGRTESDKTTTELIELARRELRGDSVLSDEAGFAKLQMRMARPRRRWAPGWVAGAAGLAAAAALSGLLLLSPSRNNITFEVAGGQLGEHGQVIGGEATRIRFSDGSEAALERGAEAQIENLTEHGAAVVLKRGKMRVQIAKRPHAAWTVEAGPYDVQVTGTAFDVSWSNQAQAFDLRMESGAVIVTGPLAVSGIPLRAGQHMFGGVAEGRLTVEGGNAAPVARSPAAPEAAPSPTPPAPLHTAPGPRPRAEAHNWTRQVAQGNFNAVLEEAEQRGLDRTLAGASLEELAALADAARYAGRGSVAKRVLLAERQRFAGSGPARDAAFFLGRIAEDSGGGAIEWYERYVAESPRGPYASQAFGRKMMLLHKQSGAMAAKPVASEYLKRYPNGPYAAAARKIDEESPPKP